MTLNQNKKLPKKKYFGPVSHKIAEIIPKNKMKLYSKHHLIYQNYSLTQKTNRYENPGVYEWSCKVVIMFILVRRVQVSKRGTKNT